MTQDQIIQMAIKAGMEQDGDNFFSPGHEQIDVHIDDLTRFAQAAFAAGAAAERQAIEEKAQRELSNIAALMSMPAQSSAAWNILQFIKARGQA